MGKCRSSIAGLKAQRVNVEFQLARSRMSEKVRLRLIIRLLPIVCLVYLLLTLTGADLAESKKMMSGKVIRAGILHYPPVLTITKDADGNTSFTGVDFDAINYVAKALDIQIEYVYMRPEDIKKYGLGPAQMQMIINDEVDVTLFGIVTSISKYYLVDFSTPLRIDPFRLVVPFPNEENRLLATIRPFQLEVWICLLVTLIVLAPVLAAVTGLYFRYIYQPSDQRRTIIRPIFSFNSLLYHSAFLLSHLANQGYRIRLRSRASYILAGIWFLMCVVLANAYGGVLFSFLSVPKLEPIVNSLEELGNAKKLQLIVQDKTEMAERLMKATSGPEKLIGDTLRENPSNLIANLRNVKEKLLTGNYAFTYVDLFTYGLIYGTYRESGKKCKLTLASKPVPMFSPAVWPLEKDGPYTKAISEQLQAQLEAGLIERYVQNVLPRIEQCKMENQKGAARIKPLSLVDMSSAFILFGLGISLSILVFLLELIYKRIHNHYFAADHDKVVKVVKANVVKPTDTKQGQRPIRVTNKVQAIDSKEGKVNKAPVVVVNQNPAVTTPVVEAEK